MIYINKKILMLLQKNFLESSAGSSFEILTFATLKNCTEMNAFIEDLKGRGLYADMMPVTDEQLIKEMTTAYISFFHTADSRHNGSLMPINVLAHFQQHGH